MHASETTNGKLAEARATVEQLIAWAEADSQHAAENDAPDTARDDRRRARTLRRVLALLAECER